MSPQSGLFILLWGLGTWQTDNETTDQIELCSVQKSGLGFSIFRVVEFGVLGLGFGNREPKIITPLLLERLCFWASPCCSLASRE